MRKKIWKTNKYLEILTLMMLSNKYQFRLMFESFHKIQIAAVARKRCPLKSVYGKSRIQNSVARTQHYHTQRFDVFGLEQLIFTKETTQELHSDGRTSYFLA